MYIRAKNFNISQFYVAKISLLNFFLKSELPLIAIYVCAQCLTSVNKTIKYF